MYVHGSTASEHSGDVQEMENRMKISEFRGIREDVPWDGGEKIAVQTSMGCDGDAGGNAGAVAQLGNRDCIRIHEIGEQARLQFCERVEVQVSADRRMVAMEMSGILGVAEQWLGE